MLEGNQSADYRLFPDGQADAVSVLQRERCFFIGKAKLLGFGPHGSDLRGGSSRPHQRDRGVEIFTAAFVSIDHGVRSVTYREAAVGTSAVTHVGNEDVVIDRI